MSTAAAQRTHRARRRALLAWSLAGVVAMAGAQVWLGVYGVQQAAAVKVSIRPAAPGEAWPMAVPANWPASPRRWEAGRSVWADYEQADDERGFSAWLIRTGLPLRSAQGRMWFTLAGDAPPTGLSGGTLVQVRELPLVGGSATFPTEVLWPAMVFNLVLGAAGGWGAGALALWLLARRRERQGGCPSCGYSRAGLAPGARCPECGAGPGAGVAAAGPLR